MATPFSLACDPLRVLGTKPVARQETCDYSGYCPHAGIISLFRAMFSVRYWPHKIGEVFISVPPVAAFFLLATDSSATLHSPTAANVGQAYHGFPTDLSNAAFVKKMGKGCSGSPGQALNTQVSSLQALHTSRMTGSCSRALCRGGKADEPRGPGGPPCEPGRSVDRVRECITSLHNRSREHHLGCPVKRLAPPERAK